MRRAARKDGPHRAVVEALRAAGASVAVLEPRPEAPGVPDLLVGHRGRTMLVEVKSGRADLSPAQEAWRRGWRGCPVAVVRSVPEALDALARLREDGPSTPLPTPGRAVSLEGIPAAADPGPTKKGGWVNHPTA